MLQSSKYFKLPASSAPHSRGRIIWVVETEINLFLGIHIVESASRPLVDFAVLNDNLIKGLILCVKYLSRF
jgi:hypothetical protein